MASPSKDAAKDKTVSLRTERAKRTDAKPADVPQAGYPATRLRRNRRADWSRRLVRETTLTPDDLIWPMFVIEGSGQRQPIAAMPGVDRLSIDLAVKAAEDAATLGHPGHRAVPRHRPGFAQTRPRARPSTPAIWCAARCAHEGREVPDLGIICDVALDPYTSHGHDGLLVDGEIVNDETIEVLIAQALVQAEAGCDIFAPSDMMDGRIGAIRAALEANGFTQTQIISLRGEIRLGLLRTVPRRGGLGARQLHGDKKTYQMDPANGDEALREVALDVAEGADMVMVKPGMPYLDIVWRVKEAFGLPTFVYQTSGEYAMLAAASERGWLDRERVILESLMAFKRAGADAIFSYFAPEVAKRLKDDR